MVFARSRWALFYTTYLPFLPATSGACSCQGHEDCATGFCMRGEITSECTGSSCSPSLTTFPNAGTSADTCPPQEGCTSDTTRVSDLTGWAAPSTWSGGTDCQNWPLWDESTCRDGLFTYGTERGVDCGGECVAFLGLAARCPSLSPCFADSDCSSGLCQRSNRFDPFTGICANCT